MSDEEDKEEKSDKSLSGIPSKMQRPTTRIIEGLEKHHARPPLYRHSKARVSNKDIGVDLKKALRDKQKKTEAKDDD